MKTVHIGAGWAVVGTLFLVCHTGCGEGLQFPTIRKAGNFLGDIDASFKPKLDRATLKVHGLDELPMGPIQEWSQSFDVGDVIIRVHNSSISAVGSQTRRLR